MVKCTKQWTETERAILYRASGLLQDGTLGFVCNAVESAADSLTSEKYAFSFVGAEFKVAELNIKEFIRNLLGGANHLSQWRTSNGLHYVHSGDIERRLIRVRWVSWMLGDIAEADGSEFPVEEEL